MPALEYRGLERVLYRNLEEQKMRIADEMRRRRFTDVRVSRLDVAGETNGAHVSVTYYPIAGTNRYWEIIICAGVTQENVITTIHAVDIIIRYVA